MVIKEEIPLWIWRERWFLTFTRANQSHGFESC